jgi:uncharacterized membrane protein
LGKRTGLPWSRYGNLLDLLVGRNRFGLRHKARTFICRMRCPAAELVVGIFCLRELTGNLAGAIL